MLTADSGNDNVVCLSSDIDYVGCKTAIKVTKERYFQLKK